MNKELQSFSVNKNDPFFTADKWNESLNYSECFEKMINKMLGDNFKGIYKPFENYNLYDYVWFNNDYYQITDTKSNSTEAISKQNYDNAYYYNSNYISLNPNKKIVRIIGQNEYELSNETFEKFYLFEDEIIALKEQNLYKINVLEKTTTPINYIFSRTIKDVKKDKFQLYILSDYMIEVGNSLNDDLTETKELYSSDLKITDIAVNDTDVLILKEDNKVDIINKSTGALKSSFTISQEINHDLAKVVCSDDYSLIVYDGISQLLMFFSNNGSFIYSGNSENDYLRYGVSSLTYNDNHIIATNDAVFLVYLASRYNLDKVEASSFMISNNLVSKRNVEEYIDFSKGQFETKNLIPEYTKISSLNNEGVVIDTNPLKYTFDNFLNKTIKLKISAESNFAGEIFKVFFGNKKISKKQNYKAGINVIYVDFEKDKYKISLYNEEGRLVELSNYISVSESNNYIEFSSSKAYILKEFIIFDKIIDFNQKDYFYHNNISSFDLQASSKSYPYSYVKTDENGNININIQDNSILKNDKGYKVNLSDDTSKEDSDVGFSLKGAKKLWDKVINKLTEMNNSLAPLKHRHDWDNLDKVPEATINNAGIVRLSNSTSGTSELMAASEKAVKLTYDKANHEHPYLKVTEGGEVVGATTFKDISVNKLKVADNSVSFGSDKLKVESNTYKFSSGASSNSNIGVAVGYTNSSGTFVQGALISNNGTIKANEINSKKVIIDGYTVTIG